MNSKRSVLIRLRGLLINLLIRLNQWLIKLLLNLYHPTKPSPTSKLIVWIRRLIQKEETNQYASEAKGRSPLDIPNRGVVYSFIAAAVFALVIGNAFTGCLWDKSSCELRNKMKREIYGIKSFSNDEEIFDIVINKFIPYQSQSVKRGKEEKFRQDIETSFKNSNAFEAVWQFLTLSQKDLNPNEISNLSKEQFEKYIIGELPRKISPNIIELWNVLAPTFFQRPESEILELAGIKELYGTESSIVLKKCRRDIIINAIMKIRAELNSEYSKPRRLLQMLAGNIQWITFILAIWCLFLLIGFRIPWAKLQMKLVILGRLPWYHPDTPHLWEIKNKPIDKEYFFKTLHDDHPFLFIPARLIQEIFLAREHERSLNLREYIRERVAAYRRSIDEGEYEIINFLIWAVPTLGFLGTIIGIVGAMENAANIVRAIGPIEQAAAIKQVGVYLGTAFDTTFVALIWVLPLNFLLARLRKIEANLFESLEFEANRYLPEQLEETAANIEKERSI
ncbi:MAG: hypothetical protein DKINENOH_04868 [bacterium]|nr:hypothetical protein [bacterium]